MNQLNSLNNIASYLATFVYTVKGLNAINQFGINYLSETVLIPIFREVFDYDDLINLNIEDNNIAGIDLGDAEKKVAFQITSSSDNDKITHTLNQFVKYKHYEKYESLYIYIISEKQTSYADKGYADTIKNKFKFSKDHIFDYRDLLKTINEITDYDKIQRIENLLQKQFSKEKMEIYQNKLNQPNHLEDIHTNLCEIRFPTHLYIASLVLDRKKIIKEYSLSPKLAAREFIIEYKKQNHLRFSGEWTTFSNTLITFQDLHDDKNDLTQIIDKGTIEKIGAEEFYEQNEEYKKTFKALLKYCFAHQAFHLKIKFLHKEGLFVFMPVDAKVVRSYTWHSGKKAATRDVIRVKMDAHKKPWYYTHLAFRINFKFFENKWFCEITPDYFISKDGENIASIAYKVITFLKQHQFNQHVFNDLKCIIHLLTQSYQQTDMFNTKPQSNSVIFLRLKHFSNAPRLYELDWVENENPDNLSKIKDTEGLLPLNF
jgi:hypothetical protein